MAASKYSPVELELIEANRGEIYFCDEPAMPPPRSRSERRPTVTFQNLAGDKNMLQSKSSEHLYELREGSESETENGHASSTLVSTPPSALGARNGERRLSKRKVLQLSLDESSGRWKVVQKTQGGSRFNLSSLTAVMLGKRHEPDCHIKVVVILLFVAIVSTITSVTFLYKNQQNWESKEAQIYYWDQERQFDLLNADGKLILKGYFAEHIPEDLNPAPCISIDKDGELNEICRDWKYRAHMDINYDPKSHGVSCYHVHWQGHADDTILRDCFDLKDAKWYGMGQVKGSHWPLNGLNQDMTAFVTSHDPNTHPLGSIIKRYWLSSNGVSIRVPLNVPLYVSFNSTAENPQGDGQLCLEAKTSKYPYDSVDQLPHLDYTLCTGPDMLTIHREISKNWTKKHIDQPSDKLSHEAFLEDPIWATNIRSVKSMSQSAVVEFADTILEYGLEPGFILLDSRWESKTGELNSDATTFADSGALYTVLRNKGFKVLLTLSPYIEISASVLHDASRNRRVISDPHLDVPLLTQCFGRGSDHMCALMDMMNSSTRVWFRKRIQNQILKDTQKPQVDGFLFKGAQVSLMPHHIHSFQHDIINPDYFQMYYKNVARHMSHLVGMNTAVGVQRLNAFYQLLPLTSTWQSLQTVIPTLLSLGIIGYAAINPGSVGGELVAPGNETFNRELYIRWLELACFLPIIQFSSPPGSETNDLQIIKLNKRLLKMRQESVLPLLKAGLRESMETGTAIIRPLFFIEPEGEESYSIVDEFSVMDKLIVAPVLEEGKRERDIYLPQGWWRDEITGQQVRGGKWLRNYNVPLDRVPYFTRVASVAATE